MRLRVSIACLIAATAIALPAYAQSEAPSIDVVEVTGVIDAPIARYLRERIQEAEERDLSLLVIQLDSPGMLKASETDPLPDLAEMIRASSVPVAVHVGPRNAQAAGGAVTLVEAAHVAAIGSTAILDLSIGFELATGDPITPDELDQLETLARQRGRQIGEGFEPRRYAAGESQDLGLVDLISPGVAEMLVSIHETTIDVNGKQVTLDIPKDLSTVRFWQPGPLRRVLHALSNPALAYLILIAAIMLLVFEASQPGFGVAGGTAVALGLAATYAFTVLPATWWAMGLILGGSLLLWWDVIRDELLIPTFLGLTFFTIGSLNLLPTLSVGTRLPVWLSLSATAGLFIFFAPVMTLVKRQRQPITTVMKRALVGETGDVRSMLNPEGYVMVSGELWRARLAAGGRLRVGETVKVTGVDGAVLLVADAASDQPGTTG